MLAISVNFIASSSSSRKPPQIKRINQAAWSFVLLAEKLFPWPGELGSGKGKSGVVNPHRGELAAHRFIQQTDFYPVLEQFSIPPTSGASREDPRVGLGPRVASATCWDMAGQQSAAWGWFPEQSDTWELQGLRDTLDFFQNHRMN